MPSLTSYYQCLLPTEHRFPGQSIFTAVCIPGTPLWEVQRTPKYSWFQCPSFPFHVDYSIHMPSSSSLSPLVGPGYFILIIVYLYTPGFLILSAHFSFASLIDIITHLVRRKKPFYASVYYNRIIGKGGTRALRRTCDSGKP